METEKAAFDLADLKAKLKDKGLPEVENLAKSVVGAVFEWVKEGIRASATPVDDFAIGLVEATEKMINAKLDAIDGK